MSDLVERIREAAYVVEGDPSHKATRIARAICEELGIKREMVDDIEMGEALLGFGRDTSPLGPVRAALTALLDAAAGT